MTNLWKIKLSILFTLFILLVIFFSFPDKASAAMTSVVEVLKNTDKPGQGQIVKQIWTTMMDFINGLVIAVLIVMAFAEILHININTYGVKKILPALLLAIIAANFSFLMCRLAIDLANVASSKFLEGSTSMTGLLDMFKSPNDTSFAGLGKPSPEGNMFWFIIGQLLIIAGAILIYILAFLMIIRNWLIYFLVSIAPLAMLAMVLPQTKSLFTQWMTQFMRWVFLPVVSLFWIWVGVQWYTHINNDVYLLNYIFAAACFYFAITTPFKMGGAIMGAWGNVGKKAWGATGGKGVDYLKAKGSATWQARSANIQSAIKNATGIGSGLDAANQKLADAEKRKGLVSSKYKGKYIEKKGQKRAKWEIDNASMEGSEDYASKMAREKLLKTPKGREWTSQKRIKSQEAIAEMETSDKNWEGLNDEMKKNFFRQKDANGQVIAEGSDEYERRKVFFEEYAKALLDADIRGREGKKATGDLPKIAAEERIAIDNAQSKFDDATQLDSSYTDFTTLHTNTNRTPEQQKDYDKAVSKLQTAGYDTNKILTDVNYRNITDGELKTSIIEAKAKVDEKINQLKGQYKTTKVVDLPIALRPYVKAAANGDIVGFDRMEFIERSRTSQYVNEGIKEGAANALELHSATEMGQTYLHGNATENISTGAMNNYFSGKQSSNDADTNRRILEFVVGGSRKGLIGRITPDSHVIVKNLLTALHQNQNVAGLKELADNIKAQDLALSQTVSIDSQVIETAARNNHPNDEVAVQKEIADEINNAIKAIYDTGVMKKQGKIITAIKGNDAIGLKGYPSGSM